MTSGREEEESAIIKGFDTPSGSDTMKRRRKREKTGWGVNLEYSFVYVLRGEVQGYI